MKPTYDHPHDVLKFCQENPSAALVVVTGVTGGTLRSAGALMAVTPEKVAGYISNGCVDADIVMRARRGEIDAFVYGEDSPFRDITLPCGGRLEISIFQNVDRHAVSEVLQLLDNREPAVLNLGEQKVTLVPKLRLRIAGKGAAFSALASLAGTSGFDLALQSPDQNHHPRVQHLVDPAQVIRAQDDSRTAVVLLFHDHDWEPALLKQALAGPAFYVGAMGSQKTHDARRITLASIGVLAEDIERLHAPIGLIPTQRNAKLLAISILAEIIQSAQAKGLL